LSDDASLQIKDMGVSNTSSPSVTGKKIKILQWLSELKAKLYSSGIFSDEFVEKHVNYIYVLFEKSPES
jgi:hypothetical protein